MGHLALMMEGIRLESALHTLHERRIAAAVLSRLPLLVFFAQISVVTPHLQKLRKLEVGILRTDLHGDAENTRMHQRRTVYRQLEICHQKHAHLMRAHSGIVVLQITVYLPCRVNGMTGCGLKRSQQFIP